MHGCVLDFDGVLAQSMELHAEAYRRSLKRFGVAPTNREVFLLEGARSETLIREILERHHHRLEGSLLEELAHEKQRIFESLGPAPLYPGADAMVRRIRAAVDRLGIVTGTRRENLDRLIPELLPSFDAVLAQDAYTKDKPDPEPYARAAQALRIPPADCCAVENAVRGVQSARRAGYRYVVAITSTLRSEELASAGADRIVANTSEAAQAVEAWAKASSGVRAR